MVHLLVCERFIEDTFATNVVLGNKVLLYFRNAHKNFQAPSWGKNH